MRSVFLFNDNWLFSPNPETSEHPLTDEQFENITLPHTNKVLPHHNFDISEYTFTSTYRKHFTFPEPINGRRVFIDFDGAMLASTVTINGHTFPEYRGGFTPFSYDITDYLNETGDNFLSIQLDSSERNDIPPFGYVVDYLTFGGIYRDVHLRYVEPSYIKDVFVKTKFVDDCLWWEFDATLTNQTSTATHLDISLRNKNDTLIHSFQHELPESSDSLINLTQISDLPDDLPSIQLWTMDEPTLYTITFELFAGDTKLDEYPVTTGFRTTEFRKNGGFYLNGERVKLFGLNRHQNFPYFGAAAPERLQRRDADILKYELGCNIVRTSHYPQSPHFLNRCDEIGLLVFEEIPGWQHIGDEDWKQLSVEYIRSMIERDRNHPSIIIWGVRINESLDDEAFYRETNALAHELDPTRETGGVRYFQDSQFLEDVFTFNDFSNSVEEPQQLPHLVTEFNGHMFPTKTWDQEERRIEHALRHARIHNTQMGMDNISGAIGWCAFDYNTHREFGSGDRICYHGVMDIFRLPKFAGHFYASQIDPKHKVVLQVASNWTMGDRSVGGNNPLTIFSNCEEIEVYVGEQHTGKFIPDKEQFPHLKYPPFHIIIENQVWGSTFKDLRVVGYINGEVVAEQKIDSRGLPCKLELTADDTELRADGRDMTRIVFKITDAFGNVLPYSTQVVSFDIEGSAIVYGENPFALVGGQAAIYVRATHKQDDIKITAHTRGLDSQTVIIKVQ